MFIFLATAKTWENPDEPSQIGDHVVVARDYGDAMQKIEEFYGDELQSIHIEQISDMPIITIDENMMDRLRELNNF